jgi:hypothetical protein
LPENLIVLLSSLYLPEQLPLLNIERTHQTRLKFFTSIQFRLVLNMESG